MSRGPRPSLAEFGFQRTNNGLLIMFGPCPAMSRMCRLVYGAIRPIGRIAKFDIIIAMRIHVLALNGVFDTGLAAVLDASARPTRWRR